MVNYVLSLTAILISSIAFLAFILSNYDKLSKHYVAWRYNADVQIGIRLPQQDHDFLQQSTISHTELAEFDGELMFILAIKNSGDFDVDLELTVRVGDEIMTAHEYYGAADKIRPPYRIRRLLGHPPKEYDYGTYTCQRGSYTNKEQFLLVLEPADATIHVLRSSTVELRGEIYADVSNFTIPGTNFNFPRNIGRTRFAPIRKEYEILGPEHEETDNH